MRIHRYYNQASRECEAMGVPYQYNGFLFDSNNREVYDQVRKLTLYPPNGTRLELDHQYYTGTEKLGTWLSKGDDLIVYYQQGYLRAVVSKITSHKNIYVHRQPIGNAYLHGYDAVGFMKDPTKREYWDSLILESHYDRWYQPALADIFTVAKELLEANGPTALMKEHPHTKKWEKLEPKHWTYNQDYTCLQTLKQLWYQNPNAGKIMKVNNETRQWRLQNCDLYAVPKERQLYLKLLQG